MKVGDKLVCKKYQNQFGRIYLPNHTYTIQEISDGADFFIISDFKGMWFSSIHPSIYNNRLMMNYIWYVFYSPQEIRKMKINKIYESRR